MSKTQNPKPHLTVLLQHETVMSCRQPAALDDYALVLRNKDGEYCKLWDASAFKRGTSVTVETITWDNGYSFIPLLHRRLSPTAGGLATAPCLFWGGFLGSFVPIGFRSRQFLPLRLFCGCKLLNTNDISVILFVVNGRGVCRCM